MKQLIGDLLDAWNTHDVDRVAEFYAAAYEGVDVGTAAPWRGRPGAREMAGRYFLAFPDLHFQAEAAVVEDNRVALAWIARGTHRGPLMNIPPTERLVEFRGVTLLDWEDGQVRRGLHVWDLAGLLRTIGLLPDL